jgi:hypothetical protein
MFIQKIPGCGTNWPSCGSTTSGCRSWWRRKKLSVTSVVGPNRRPSRAWMRPASATDLVGRIYGGGIAGAEVRLITDKGMGFTVKIGKYVRNADGTTSLKFVEHLTPLVQGMGHGQMEIRNTLSVAQAAEAHLEAGDIVLLDDREKWPAGVQGFKVGRIVSIKKQANAPLVADVLIEPEVDLLHLSSVLVLRGGEKK